LWRAEIAGARMNNKGPVPANALIMPRVRRLPTRWIFLRRDTPKQSVRCTRWCFGRECTWHREINDGASFWKMPRTLSLSDLWSGPLVALRFACQPARAGCFSNPPGVSFVGKAKMEMKYVMCVEIMGKGTLVHALSLSHCEKWSFPPNKLNLRPCPRLMWACPCLKR